MVMMMITKSFYECSAYQTFDERLAYLLMHGIVSEETFGSKRYVNQVLYASALWKSTRSRVIIRDEGCDLGIRGLVIRDKIIVHHINPITELDIIEANPCVYALDNLVCTSLGTHNAIHYGTHILSELPMTRSKNDTIPWK